MDDMKAVERTTTDTNEEATGEAMDNHEMASVSETQAAENAATPADTTEATLDRPAPAPPAIPSAADFVHVLDPQHEGMKQKLMSLTPKCRALYDKVHPEILRHTQVLLADGGLRQARILRGDDRPHGAPRVESAFFNDPVVAANEIAFAQVNGGVFPGEGYYMTVNSVGPGAVMRAKSAYRYSSPSFQFDRFNPACSNSQACDDDVQEITDLPMDFDSKRDDDVPEVVANMSSAEKDARAEAARIVMQDTKDYLCGTMGWPEPVVVFSGSGYHLHFRVTGLPNTTENRLIVKNLYLALEHRFSEAAADAKFDIAVANPSRIMRIAGTINAKGEPPWKFTRVVEAPDALVPVTREQIEAVLDDIKCPRKATSHEVSSAVVVVDPAGADEHTLDRCRAYLATLPPTVRGQQPELIMLAAARHCAEFGLTKAQAVGMLTWFSQEKAPPNDQWSEREIRHKMEDGYRSTAQRGLVGSKVQFNDIVISGGNLPDSIATVDFTSDPSTEDSSTKPDAVDRGDASNLPLQDGPVQAGKQPLGPPSQEPPAVTAQPAQSPSRQRITPPPVVDGDRTHYTHCTSNGKPQYRIIISPLSSRHPRGDLSYLVPYKDEWLPPSDCRWEMEPCYLYMTPEVAAADVGELIILTNSLRDVEMLHARGVLATCLAIRLLWGRAQQARRSPCWSKCGDNGSSRGRRRDGQDCQVARYRGTQRQGSRAAGADWQAGPR